MEYSAGLTAEPFLYIETKIIVNYLLDGFEINELKKKNIDENLIKYKSQSSLKRVNSPIFRRLSVLSKYELKQFVNADLETSKYILLYAIMKTDRLVFEFINEIYKEKLILRKEYIDKVEFDSFLEDKKIYSELLAKMSESTTGKLRQVVFKILLDSGLVQKEKDRFKIIRPLLKQSFIDMIESKGDKEYIIAIQGGRV